MAMRQNHVAGNLTDMVFRSGLKLASLHITMAATDETISKDWPPVLVVDPNGGAKDMLLPAEADSKGLVFFVYNKADAAENLVLKDDSDTQTIVTIAQDAAAMVHCDGTTWRHLAGE